MTPWTLVQIDRALRICWAADTCSTDDLDRSSWSPENPAWGHCDITALLINDLLGGDLVVGAVHSVDGARQGHHWWNRLPSGIEIDLTREQFRDGQTIADAQIVKRPAAWPRRRGKQYELLRSRVAAHLGPLPAPRSPS